MRLIFIPLLLALGALLPGCARRSYQGQALAPAVLATHRTVAVLPFEVALERLRLGDVAISSGSLPDSTARRLSRQLESAERAECRQRGHQLQAELQAALMRQQVRRPSAVAFQHPADTNQRLARAGITDDNLTTCSPAELRAALGVDAVLSGRTVLRQLLPGGVSVALFVLTDGNPMADNGVRTRLIIHDTRTGQPAWRFDHELRGKPSVSPAALANALVRDMRGSFPYFRE